MIRYIPIALALCVATSCRSAPSVGDLIPFGSEDPEAQVVRHPGGPTAANDRAAGWSSRPLGGGEPVLYGRDGMPVTRTDPGTLVQTGEPLDHGVQEPEGTRTALLEMYGDLKKERDALVLDLEALSAQEALSFSQIDELQQQNTTLEARIAELEQRNKELDEQVYDLAARLTQSQIGRLEAERALLEASLEWRRMNASNNASLAEEGR